MNGKKCWRNLTRRSAFRWRCPIRTHAPYFFDQDEILFEQNEDQLYIMADLGTAAGRSDAYARLLEANWLGVQSGQAYASGENRSKAQSKGFRERVMRKGTRGRVLSFWEEIRNKCISKIRGCIEVSLGT